MNFEGVVGGILDNVVDGSKLNKLKFYHKFEANLLCIQIQQMKYYISFEIYYLSL